MYNNFSQTFSSLMRERHITQTELANALKVKQNTVSQWMSGKREPDFDTLIKLCILFGVTPAVIMNFDNTQAQIKQGFLRDVVGNDKQFQAEQARISEMLLNKGVSPIDVQEECEKLYNQYYEAYKAKYGF